MHPRKLEGAKTGSFLRPLLALGFSPFIFCCSRRCSQSFVLKSFVLMWAPLFLPFDEYDPLLFILLCSPLCIFLCFAFEYFVLAAAMQLEFLPR